MGGAPPIELEVESVGVRGDGIAQHDGERIFLPFTAPGDRVSAVLGPRRGEGRAGRVLALLRPGARQAPVCPHFGTCGGCALQHLADDAYVAAKEAWLKTALRQHGLDDGVVAPLLRLPAGTRRRARFAVSRPRGAATRIGFHTRLSHDVVDLRACAVLHPKLLGLLPALRDRAAVFWPGGEGAATATLAESGVDLLLELADEPKLAALEAMAELAAVMDLARLSWRLSDAMPTPAAQRRPVRVAFAGVAVDLPAGAFLQASAEADAALAAAVRRCLNEPRRTADLFAGVGTLSFALAERAAVHAVEIAAPAVAALMAAAVRAGLGHLSAEQRDLDAHPLSSEELDRFDAVVFDPPRAGARAQSAALARSAVPRVVAVSCNPASFARDARTLVDGGYQLVEVQPIDGFLWSAQLELVARFDKA